MRPAWASTTTSRARSAYSAFGSGSVVCPPNRTCEANKNTGTRSSSPQTPRSPCSAWTRSLWRSRRAGPSLPHRVGPAMTSWHRQRRSTVRDVGCNVANSAALVILTRTKTDAGTATGASQPPSPRARARAHTHEATTGAPRPAIAYAPPRLGRGPAGGFRRASLTGGARRRASSARVPPRRRPARPATKLPASAVSESDVRQGESPSPPLAT